MSRLAVLVQCGAVVAYCIWVALFATEMPFWDDFDIQLSFILSWLDAPSWRERLGYLFARNGEHFVVTNKIATLFDYYLFSELNFRRLIIYGNIAFLGGVVLFARYAAPSPWWRAWALVLVLCPQYPQSFLWAAGSLQHLSVFLWVMLALLCARSGSVFSLFFFALATVTQGNGALAAGAWSVTLLLQGRLRQGLRWLAGAGILLFPVISSSSDSQHLALSLVTVARYIAVLLGSSVAPTADMSALVGSCAIIGAVIALRPIARREPFLAAILVWLLATAAANAVARAQFGVDYGFIQSRYRIVSVLFIAALVLSGVALCGSVARRRLLGAIACALVAVVYVIKLPAAVVEASFRRDTLEQATVRYSLFNTGLSYPDPRNPLLRQAESRQVVAISAPSYERYRGTARELPAKPITSGRIVQNIEWLLCSAEYVYIAGYSFHQQESGAPIVLLFVNGVPTVVSRESALRPDVVAHHHREDALHSGISVVIPTSTLPEGPIQVRLGVEQSDGTVKISPESKSISLPCS